MASTFGKHEADKLPTFSGPQLTVRSIDTVLELALKTELMSLLRMISIAH